MKTDFCVRMPVTYGVSLVHHTETLHFFTARITARHSATMKKFATNYYVNQPFLLRVTFASLLLT